MKLKLREFNGLYTNVDSADVKPEIFSKFKNIKVRPGFIQAHKAGIQPSEFPLPSGHILVAEEFVILDGDKVENEFVGEEQSELRNIYVQNLEQYQLRITRAVDGIHHYFLRKTSETDFVEVERNISVVGVQPIPKIVNERGIVKIFFKDKAAWLGKINHKRWLLNSNDFEEITNSDGAGNKFWVEPLYFDYTPVYNLWEVSNPNLSDEVHLDVTAERRAAFGNVNILGDTYEVANVQFTDLFGNNVPYRYPSGYMHFYIRRLVLSDNNLLTRYYLHENENTIIRPDLTTETATNPVVNTQFDPAVPLNPDNLRTLPGVYHVITDDFGEFDNLDAFIATINGLNVAGIAAGDDRGFSPEVTVMEFVTTLLTEEDEYVLTKQTESFNETDPYIIQLNSTGVVTVLPGRTWALKVYMRFGEHTDDLKSKDYEHSATFNLVANKYPPTNTFINQLTPNGVFLTQTVGKAFDEATYSIITAPTDYINVGGVSFILKEGNVHFPAIGAGSILNGTFYEENFIPNIEGQTLAAYGNLLGVFSAQKELMTLIDFQAVEGQMIFYVKGTFDYKTKDFRDIVQSSEGTFIHLKEGIYVTDGYERTLVSEPINDIVRKYFSTGSIFYSSFRKELYYLNAIGLFMFDFETRAWSEFDATLTSNGNIQVESSETEGSNPIPEPVIVQSITEDFEGNIHLLSEGLSHILEFTAEGEGEFNLRFTDLQEHSIGKKLQYVTADAKESTLTVFSKEIDYGQREVKKVSQKLSDRAVSKYVDIDVKFSGTLYGLEAEVELTPYIKI